MSLLLSCSGEGDPFAPPSTRPVVTGIFARSEDGEVIGVWRDPQVGGALASPNPFYPAVSLRFENPVAGRVRVDVVAMRLPGESEVTTRSVLGSAIFGSETVLVRELLDDRLSPGVHEVVWDGRDARGTRVLTGFYRLRVALESGSLFDDVYLYAPGGPPPPPGLRRFLQE